MGGRLNLLTRVFLREDTAAVVAVLEEFLEKFPGLAVVVIDRGNALPQRGGEGAPRGPRAAEGGLPAGDADGEGRVREALPHVEGGAPAGDREGVPRGSRLGAGEGREGPGDGDRRLPGSLPPDSPGGDRREVPGREGRGVRSRAGLRSDGGPVSAKPRVRTGRRVRTNASRPVPDSRGPRRNGADLEALRDAVPPEAPSGSTAVHGTSLPGLDVRPPWIPRGEGSRSLGGGPGCLPGGEASGGQGEGSQDAGQEGGRGAARPRRGNPWSSPSDSWTEP